MTEKSNVLITVPHALCDPISYPSHMCDRIAKEMGRRLNSKLTGSIYLEADEPRYECDLNRDECNLTKYRQSLTKLLKSTDAKTTDLFDVHSFPAESEYSSAHDLLVLINLDLGKRSENGPLSNLLSEMGKKEGIDVKTAIGSPVNSIVKEGLSMGIRSFLLEFNEEVSIGNREKTVNLVVKWYNTYLKGRHYNTEMVVSPTDGVVESFEQNGLNIYPVRDRDPFGSPQDRHDIYAPVSGKIDKIESFQGSWKRRVFEADVEKIAPVGDRSPFGLSFSIQGITTWIEPLRGDPSELGPKYITDRVRLVPKEGDEVKQGEKCGEIIIGSLSGIIASQDKLWFTTVIHKQELSGGKSIVGVFIKRSDLP